jgi:hypothetical protein
LNNGGIREKEGKGGRRLGIEKVWEVERDGKCGRRCDEVSRRKGPLILQKEARCCDPRELNGESGMWLLREKKEREKREGKRWYARGEGRTTRSAHSMMRVDAK